MGPNDPSVDIVDGVPQPHVVRAVVDHMNADHADDCLALCQAASGRTTISSARLAFLDGEGLTFEVVEAGTTSTVRIAWLAPIRERADIRHQVAEMTHTARAGSGDGSA